MSNAEPSDLTHNYTTTLIVDCGGTCQSIVIPSYPTEYDKGACLPVGKNPDHPTPIAVEFDTTGEHSRVGLYSNNEIGMILNTLQDSMQNILQAGIVNEKQRQALAQIVAKEFNTVKNEIYFVSLNF